MKKRHLGFFAFVFAFMFMLAACNQTAAPVAEEEPNKEEETTEEENISELTLEEVFQKSAEASENLKSFSVKMGLKQEMTAAGEEAMNIDSDINMDVTTDPLSFYQKMAMSLGDTGESFDTESYFTTDGVYIFDGTGGQWMKFPQEMADQLMQISNQQTNPAEELNKLKQFVEDFKFEQDDKNYILTLNASGEKFNNFIKETAAESLPAELAASEEIFNDMTINQINYVIHIDKETFYPMILNMTMDMEIGIEGEQLQIVQNMNGEYLNHNKVEAISVPQEVIDLAVEMEM